MKFCDEVIELPGSTVELGGRNSLAAWGFANRFESRRVALKPRVLPESKRRSGSCLRFCAVDRCRRNDAVATAEKPKSSKINERRMRPRTAMCRRRKKVGYEGPCSGACFLRLYRGVSSLSWTSKLRLAHIPLAPILAFSNSKNPIRQSERSNYAIRKVCGVVQRGVLHSDEFARSLGQKTLLVSWKGTRPKTGEGL